MNNQQAEYQEKLVAIQFTEPCNGQYEVTIDLKTLMGDCQHCAFEKRLREIYRYEREYAFVSSIKNGILRYKSETLLPEEGINDRPKILFVFGNPANHSVIHNMFFFSNTNGSRHKLWGELEEAEAIGPIKSDKLIPIDARREEAKKRKKRVQNGNHPGNYVVGMTTFYSFPTSAEGGVQRVEELFKPVLDIIKKSETERILGYPFTPQSTLIFTQKSSYEVFKELASEKGKDSFLWPIRGKGSSGKELSASLKKYVNKTLGLV